MSPGYRFPNTPGKPGEPVKVEDTHPLTTLTVKSVIASPGEASKLKLAAHVIKGAAWAGESDITKVEISVDGGATWNDAVLGKDHAKYAWRLWTYEWKPERGGDYALLSRATDNQGKVQPETPVWNPSGYLANAYDRVNVYVQA